MPRILGDERWPPLNDLKRYIRQCQLQNVHKLQPKRDAARTLGKYAASVPVKPPVSIANVTGFSVHQQLERWQRPSPFKRTSISPMTRDEPTPILQKG